MLSSEVTLAKSASEHQLQNSPSSQGFSTEVLSDSDSTSLSKEKEKDQQVKD